MCNRSTDFNPSVPNSQNPDASPTQLNIDITRPAAPGDTCYECGAEIGGNVTERRVAPDEIHYICDFCRLDESEPIPFHPTAPALVTLTDTELAQEFVNRHCIGDPSARAYLAELIRRDTQRRAIESLELSERLAPGSNGGYFQALGKLAHRITRRNFLQGILGISLVSLLPKPDVAAIEESSQLFESDTESDFEQRKPPYPDAERQAVIGRWLAVIDSTLVHIESFWSYLEDCNELPPAEVDDQRLYHLMNEAHNAANELCSLLESGDSVYNLDELLAVTTGKPLGYIFLREEILRGDMDPDRMQSEINAYAEDNPQYRAELQTLLWTVQR